MPMPSADGPARGVDRDRLPVQQDLALVGLVEPVEDVHQGRLARAVLPEQRVDLSTAQLEVHRVVRDQGAEPLGDPPEFQRGRVSHCLLDRLSSGMSVSSPLAILSCDLGLDLRPRTSRPSALVSPMPDAAGLDVEDRVGRRP